MLEGATVDLTTWLYIGLAVLAGGAFGYIMLRRGGAYTPDAVLTQVQDAITVAQALVAAAEQLSETGAIDRGARFQYVFGRLRELFPNLSEDTLIAAIEGAVWLVTKSADLLEPDS